MSTISEQDLISAVSEFATREETDHYDRISLLRQIIGNAQDVIAEEVAAARASGWSWGELAPALGTTRQGAQQRFGHP